jgi:hypothetical protein
LNQQVQQINDNLKNTVNRRIEVAEDAIDSTAARMDKLLTTT